MPIPDNSLYCPYNLGHMQHTFGRQFHTCAVEEVASKFIKLIIFLQRNLSPKKSFSKKNIFFTKKNFSKECSYILAPFPTSFPPYANVTCPVGQVEHFTIVLSYTIHSIYSG